MGLSILQRKKKMKTSDIHYMNLLSPLKILLSCVAFLMFQFSYTQEKLFLQPDHLSAEEFIVLKTGKLKATIVTNRAYGDRHRAGYNGVSELYHPAQDSTPFVPEYAGLNLEHIFSNIIPEDIFEPRKHSMQLVMLGKDEVALYQKPTPQSHTESLTLFKLVAPHYIDMTFRFVVHDTDYFEQGFAGIFWASYINTPSDRKVYFKGFEKDEKKAKWIAAYSEKHGEKSTHKSVEDDHEFEFEDQYRMSLVNHFSDYRYEKPYYYGRFHNMVLAYLFEGSDLVRLSQSPTGGGEFNPAWDFQYIVPEVEAGKVYEVRVRFIYKPFVGAEDIEKEYEKWTKGN